MSSLEGFKAYKLYHALKLHFTTDYDYFKYNGKTRSSNPATYNKEKYKWLFVKIERRFDSDHNKIKQYFVSCFLMNSKVWITDILNQEYLDEHEQRMNRIRNLKKTYNKFNSKFKGPVELKKYVEVIDGEYPQMVYDLVSGDISYELFLCYDKKFKLTKYYQNLLNDKFVFPKIAETLDRYKNFL